MTLALAWARRLLDVALAALSAELAVAYLAYLVRVTAGGPYGTDFLGMYTASRLAAQRGASHIYDVSAQAAVQASITGHPEHLLIPYDFPPIHFLLVGWTQYLPYTAAYAAWAAVNVALIVVGVWALMEAAGLSGPVRTWTALMCAGFLPLFVTVLQGQADALVVCGIGLYARDLRGGRPGRAGCWLALAVVKPHVVPLLLLAPLLAGAWRAVMGVVLASLAGFLLTLPWFGLSGWSGFFSFVGRLSSGQLGPSIPILSGGFSLSRALTGPLPAVVVVALAAVLALACLVAMIGLRGEPRLQLALAGGAGLLLTPHLNVHDLVVLAVPLLLLLGYRLEVRGRVMPALTGVLAVVWAATQLSLTLGPGPVAMATLALVALCIGLAASLGPASYVVSVPSVAPSRTIPGEVGRF